MKDAIDPALLAMVDELDRRQELRVRVAVNTICRAAVYIHDTDRVRRELQSLAVLMFPPPDRVRAMQLYVQSICNLKLQQEP